MNNEKSTESGVAMKAVNMIIDHVKKRNWQYKEITFADQSDGTVWELYYDPDDRTIGIGMWREFERYPIVDFYTQTGFKDGKVDEVCMGSLEQRIKNFFWDEI